MNFVFVITQHIKNGECMKKTTTNISINIKYIEDKFEGVGELVKKELNVGGKNLILFYLLGLSNSQMISDFVVKPCILYDGDEPNPKKFMNEVLYLSEIKSSTDLDEGIEKLTHGHSLLFFPDSDQFLYMATDQIKERSLSEPPTSSVLQGPREGFVENYKTNIGLIKKILATPDLKSENVVVGRYTKTNIVIMYIDGICDKGLVNKVKNKIEAIDIDGIIDSYYISSFLEEHPESFFKQIGNAEKPDIVCAKILEGRLAIIVDGSPMVLTLPYMLFEDFQKSGDYYSSSLRATMLRWLRVFSLIVTVALPGMYVAIQLYHYKVIPLTFLITIVNSTQGIPLSPFAEILFVLILFEILYEASLRMPKYLGMAMSIVGALILGDTAVQAGIISPPAVMIVALSGITLYTIPEQASVLSLLRFAYTIAGGILGFYGIIIFTLYFIIYFNDFDNYGVPYLAPFAPKVKSDYKDAMFKANIMDMKTRPVSLKNKNKRRQK